MIAEIMSCKKTAILPLPENWPGIVAKSGKSVCRTLLLLLLSLGCQHNPTQFEPETDQVEEVINHTNLDSLTLSVQQLSGELSVTIEGASYEINSRHKDSPGNDLAADYIAGRLRGWGLKVVNDYFNDTGRNVYASQTGSRYPDEIYMICAHYDCMPNSVTAPGADDNASGTAAVLEAARVLSTYANDYTIIYAFWDEEEQGLRGSRYYAGKARDADVTILGVINLDMIGWDHDNDGTAFIGKNTTPASLELAVRAMEVNTSYQIGLSIELADHLGRSDHVSFWENGYGAIMIIEDIANDFNQYYHTSADRFSYFNQNYFHRSAKLALGTLVSLAILNKEQT